MHDQEWRAIAFEGVCECVHVFSLVCYMNLSGGVHHGFDHDCGGRVHCLMGMPVHKCATLHE